MKGQNVGIMIIMRSTQTIIMGGSRKEDNICGIKLPIDVQARRANIFTRGLRGYEPLQYLEPLEDAAFVRKH